MSQHLQSFSKGILVGEEGQGGVDKGLNMRLSIIDLGSELERTNGCHRHCKRGSAIGSIDEQDDRHHPCEVVRENLKQRLEHALVIDDVPEKLLSFLLGHLFGVLEALHNSVLLVPSRLSVDIVCEPLVLVLDGLFGIFDFQPDIGGVFIWVLVGMPPQGCLVEGLFQLG